MSDSLSFVGVSPAIRNLDDEIQCAARSDAKILLTGESGVGKEVVARLIHARSRRSRAPLVTINCAGLPETLLESELFGHVRGSFTGAYRDRQGLLELANYGTAFMDEIGEMSLRMQGMLLRFLETGEIQRVGGTRAEPRLDVRIVTATNRNLVDGLADKTFREDLYYRLNVIHLKIPPLRERREDITPLLNHFLHSFSDQYRVTPPTLAPEALARLMAYHWPGNIRELKNVIERLVVRFRDGVITRHDLPSEIAMSGTRIEVPMLPARRPTADLIYDRLVQAHESFWSAVYAPFMSRDLTRDDLRKVVSYGLEQTAGNYRELVQLFNMDPSDYKRFLNFLRKYQCHMPFQRFRGQPAAADSASASTTADEQPRRLA